MHVVVFSESVFHLDNLLFPVAPDISLNACLCVVQYMYSIVFVGPAGPLLVPRTLNKKLQVKVKEYWPFQ